MEQDELLKYTTGVLERLAIRYALVGSMASSIWGEARFTQDIDLVVDMQNADVGPLCQAFPAPDFYVSQQAAAQAVQLRRPFNVIHPESANKIDFMVLPDVAWTRAQLERRLEIELAPDCHCYVATPEDVILGKLIYFQEGGSSKHLRDMRSMLQITTTVDFDYIGKYAEQLGVGNIWREILDEAL